VCSSDLALEGQVAPEVINQALNKIRGISAPEDTTTNGGGMRPMTPGDAEVAINQKAARLRARGIPEDTVQKFIIEARARQQQIGG
jgi:hypothetical protein